MVHPIINGQFHLFINLFYSLNGYLGIILHYSVFVVILVSPFVYFSQYTRNT